MTNAHLVINGVLPAYATDDVADELGQAVRRS